MSDTSNTDEKKSSMWDKSLAYTAAFLGIVSTGLSIFITITTLSINERINNLQATNLVLDEKLKKIDLTLKEDEVRSSQLDNSVRIEAEFATFNANAFANNYKEKGLRIIWVNEDNQRNIENWLDKWINGNNLMTGTYKDGLFARQVVCLRIINAGKIPARKIKLIFKKASFDNKNGELREPYYEADIKELNWENETYEIGDLMEPSQKEWSETQMFIPLAHLSGSKKYFGTVIIPLALTWNDERQNQPGKMTIDVKGNNILKSDLRSSMLGKVR